MIKRFIGNFLTTVLFLGAFSTVAIADVISEWVATYNGPGNAWDQVKKIAVDAAGNVYVTGTSGGSTSDYLDPNNDIVTIKYNPDGEKLWEARYNNPDLADGAVGITVDQSGNVYVTGYGSRGPNGWFQYVTLKYNSNGEEVWVSRLTPSWHPTHFPVGIGVDSNGNVYVAGYSGYAASPWSAADIVTFKYNQEGILQWMKAYDTPVWGWIWDDWASAMTVDSDGNVYVAGTAGHRIDRYLRSSYDSVLLKYDTNGNLQWRATYAGPGSEDRHSAIAMDMNGNSYVTGWSRIGGDYDYVTVKYDSNGNQQWVARYSTPGGGTDVATAIAADGGGNVYVTGYGGMGTVHYTTIKYDTDGNQLWAKEYRGSGSLGDVATSIGLAGDGSAYVTGYSYSEGGGYDFATIKYSADGVEAWVRRYNGSGNGDDYANTLAIDKEGNVYVAGGSFGSGTNLDYTIVKYFLAIEVTVDVKPGSFPNSINPDSNGVIPVAILSTNDFDATTVDSSSVKFGPNRATAGHDNIEDVNGDGFMDMVLHFATEESGIQEGETSASLTGKTLDGKNITGSDSIAIVGKKR